jgi:hypothetical protein
MMENYHPLNYHKLSESTFGHLFSLMVPFTYIFIFMQNNVFFKNMHIHSLGTISANPNLKLDPENKVCGPLTTFCQSKFYHIIM